MLRIYSDQMQWFARKARSSFVARMRGYLGEHFADLTAPIADLDAWMHAVIDRTLAADVTTEPEVAQVMMVYLVVGFDDPASASWVTPILNDRRLQADGKARTLVAEARRRGIPRVDDIDLTDTLEST